MYILLTCFVYLYTHFEFYRQFSLRDEYILRQVKATYKTKAATPTFHMHLGLKTALKTAFEYFTCFIV